MNLFVLDQNPVTNAKYHVDKHVGKMLLESTQLLCTQFHLQGIEAPYKKTHQNHPCSIFCRTSRENFEWVVRYAESLHDEFQFRRDKTHKTGREVLPWIRKNMSRLQFPQEKSTSFALAMPEQYHDSNAVKAYRTYYKFEKSHLFKWTRRVPPPWLEL